MCSQQHTSHIPAGFTILHKTQRYQRCQDVKVQIFEYIIKPVPPHLGVPGHPEALEPLVKLWTAGPGHVQGLVLEYVLLYPGVQVYRT